jgi:hypothetical protein
MSATAFTDLETRAQSLLVADDYFSDITVMRASDGSVSKNVAQRLGLLAADNTDGKIGVLVLVAFRGAAAGRLSPEKLRVSAQLVVAVIENPSLNNTTGPKRACDIAGQVLRVLNLRSAEAAVRDEVAVRRFAPLEQPIAQVVSNDEMVTLYGVTNAMCYHVGFEIQTNL